MILFIGRLLFVVFLAGYLVVDLIRVIPTDNQNDIIGHVCALGACVCVAIVTVLDHITMNSQASIIASLKAMIRNNALVTAARGGQDDE